MFSREARERMNVLSFQYQINKSEKEIYEFEINLKNCFVAQETK